MSTKIRAIEVENLCHAAGGKPILADITFGVHEGEFLCIIGPNGAGKTSLLKCLARIVVYDSGTIRICGTDIKRISRRELARMVGYVPQAADPFIPFTVLEFVLSARYAHLGPFQPPGIKDLRAVEGALSLTRCSDLAHRPISTLSGGERQKVFIAAALAQETGILLLDEPTSSLDPRHTSEVHSLLRRVRLERHITVVMTTHDILSAVRLGATILALKEGRTAYLGPGDGIVQEGVLERVYDTPFLRIPHPDKGSYLVIAEDR